MENTFSAALTLSFKVFLTHSPLSFLPVLLSISLSLPHPESIWFPAQEVCWTAAHLSGTEAVTHVTSLIWRASVWNLLLFLQERHNYRSPAPPFPRPPEPSPPPQVQHMITWHTQHVQTILSVSHNERFSDVFLCAGVCAAGSGHVWLQRRGRRWAELSRWRHHRGFRSVRSFLVERSFARENRTFPRQLHQSGLKIHYTDVRFIIHLSFGSLSLYVAW